MLSAVLVQILSMVLAPGYLSRAADHDQSLDVACSTPPPDATASKTPDQHATCSMASPCCYMQACCCTCICQASELPRQWPYRMLGSFAFAGRMAQTTLSQQWGHDHLQPPVSFKKLQYCFLGQSWAPISKVTYVFHPIVCLCLHTKLAKSGLLALYC